MSAKKSRIEREEEARNTLRERRRALLRRLGERVTDEQVLHEGREPDWEDRAADEATVGLLDRLDEHDRRELAAIGAALDRLRAGSWGHCLICARPIDAQRLQAIPEAHTCAGCTDGETTAGPR